MRLPPPYYRVLPLILLPERRSQWSLTHQPKAPSPPRPHPSPCRTAICVNGRVRWTPDYRRDVPGARNMDASHHAAEKTLNHKRVQGPVIWGGKK